jgi:hypothetical protein
MSLDDDRGLDGRRVVVSMDQSLEVIDRTVVER